MTSEEQAAVAVVRCLYCGAGPGQPCIAIGRYSYAAGAARRVHQARLKQYRASLKTTAPDDAGTERGITR